MTKIVSTHNLSKSFRTRQNQKVFSAIFKPRYKYSNAVSDVSFLISEGESVAFLGPNGAGKTTTTKMMTGLIKPSSGKLSVLGYNPFDKKPEFLKQIGLVMGNKAGLSWDLTALQSFELLQKIYEIPSAEFSKRVEELTALMKVEQVLNTQIRKLSLGERMKLELIGALLHDPKILFLDEPTIGLDIDSKKNIRRFLKELHKKGKTILLTSHDMDDISAICERAVVINHGKLIYDGSMNDLHEKYSASRYITMQFSGTLPPAYELEKYGTVIKYASPMVVLGVPKSEALDIASKIGKHHSIVDITIEQVALEAIISDIFNNGKSEAKNNE